MSSFTLKELSLLCLCLTLSNLVVPSEQFLPRKRVIFPIPFPLIVPIPVLKKTQRYIYKAPKLYPVKYPVPVKVPYFVKSYDYHTKDYGSTYNTDYNYQGGPYHYGDGNSQDYSQYSYGNGYENYDQGVTTTPATTGEENVPAVPVPKAATPPRPYDIPDLGPEYTTTRKPVVARPLRPPTSINQIVSELNNNRNTQPDAAADMDRPEEGTTENHDQEEAGDHTENQEEPEHNQPPPAPVDNVPKENRFIEFIQYPVRSNQNLYHSNLAKPVRKALRSRTSRRKSSRRRQSKQVRRPHNRRRHY